MDYSILPKVTIIYKIIVGDDWYIGSTVDSLRVRMREHIRASKKSSDTRLYKAVTDVGGWDKVKVEIMTHFTHTSSEDKRKKEEEFIDLGNPKCLNTLAAYNSPEVLKERMKKHSKTWKARTFDCECGKTIKLGSKNRHLEGKLHHELLGKGVVPEVKCKKTKCECGAKVARMDRHLKSALHQRRLKESSDKPTK